jgi:hypothetical protein
MITRKAIMLVADEMYFNLNGKAILQGIYPGDLVMPTDPSTAPQLIFYFVIETDINDPFKSLIVEVTLPESQPVQQAVFVPQFRPIVFPPEKTRITCRQPLLIQNPILRAGRIEARIIHENGELQVGGPWIMLASPAPKSN